MVIAKTQYSLRNAESYFEEHLCVGDYYDQGQRVTGEWIGEAAKRLGLRGEVLAADFLRLCENQDPSTGETLTVRLKSTRIEGDQVKANRRIFFDFTISPPKSVSIAALIGEDARIEAAHQRAVRSALMELEPFAATRVRVAGNRDHRLTGNLAAALFTHDTSRAVDPHLHTHCIVFNATYDPEENRWKALENRELLRARRYVESVYYHELARQLQACGYQIRNQIRGDFEIVGVPEEMCRRFSKRHAQIDRAVDTLLQERPELSGANLKELREWLAIKGRQRKQPTLARSELGTLWASQTTPAEREQIRQLSANSPSPEGTVSNDQILREAVQWSEDHLFDRHSVVPEFQIWQEALDRLRGHQVPASDLKRITAARGYIRDEHRPFEVTLRPVLAREWEIVQITKDGRGECAPLISEPRPLPAELDEEQRQALRRLLTSTHLVSLFRGGAGTGKSFVLRHLVKEVQSCGRAVVVLTPQRQQVVEMERDGFPAPQTVASFLRKYELPRGALVVVDEAGQIGGPQMLDLLRTVRERNARVLLSGDTRQHGPVEAPTPWSSSRDSRASAPWNCIPSVGKTHPSAATNSKDGRSGTTARPSKRRRTGNCQSRSPDWMQQGPWSPAGLQTKPKNSPRNTSGSMSKTPRRSSFPRPGRKFTGSMPRSGKLSRPKGCWVTPKHWCSRWLNEAAAREASPRVAFG